MKAARPGASNWRHCAAGAPRSGFPSDDFRGSIRHRDVGGDRHRPFRAQRLARSIRTSRRNQGDAVPLCDADHAAERAQPGLAGEQRAGASRRASSASSTASGPSSRASAGATTQLIAYLPAAEVDLGCLRRRWRARTACSGRVGVGALARSTLLAIARSADQLNDDDAAHARQMLTGVVRRLVDGERWASVRDGTGIARQPHPRLYRRAAGRSGPVAGA
jgi:hypothetical protein